MYGCRCVDLIPRRIYVSLRQHDAIDRKIRDTAARDGVIIALPDDMGQVDHFREYVLPGYLIGPAKARKNKPERAGWNGADVNELTEFPTGRLDDQVDPSANGYTLIADPRFQPLAFA